MLPYSLFVRQQGVPGWMYGRPACFIALPTYNPGLPIQKCTFPLYIYRLPLYI